MPKDIQFVQSKESFCVLILFICELPPQFLYNVIHMVVRCCSVTKTCLTLCCPMDCSMPDFPVLHYFLEFVQTHVHCVNDAIQPSHRLLPPSPPVMTQTVKNLPAM